MLNISAILSLTPKSDNPTSEQTKQLLFFVFLAAKRHKAITRLIDRRFHFFSIRRSLRQKACLVPCMRGAHLLRLRKALPKRVADVCLTHTARHSIQLYHISHHENTLLNSPHQKGVISAGGTAPRSTDMSPCALIPVPALPVPAGAAAYLTGAVRHTVTDCQNKEEHQNSQHHKRSCIHRYFLPKTSAHTSVSYCILALTALTLFSRSYFGMGRNTKYSTAKTSANAAAVQTPKPLPVTNIPI